MAVQPLPLERAAVPLQLELQLRRMPHPPWGLQLEAVPPFRRLVATQRQPNPHHRLRRALPVLPFPVLLAPPVLPFLVLLVLLSLALLAAVCLPGLDLCPDNRGAPVRRPWLLNPNGGGS